MMKVLIVGRTPQIVVVLALLALSATEARAYTDPGTGILAWQIIAAAVVGLLFYLRRGLDWIHSKLRGHKG